MAFYNRRLEVLARKRLAAGTYGKNNLARRHLLRTPFEANTKAVRHLLHGMRVWLGLELETLFVRPVPALPQNSEATLVPRMAEAS
jgi:hypothetical protein